MVLRSFMAARPGRKGGAPGANCCRLGADEREPQSTGRAGAQQAKRGAQQRRALCDGRRSARTSPWWTQVRIPPCALVLCAPDALTSQQRWRATMSGSQEDASAPTGFKLAHEWRIDNWTTRRASRTRLTWRSSTALADAGACTSVAPLAYRNRVRARARAYACDGARARAPPARRALRPACAPFDAVARARRRLLMDPLGIGDWRDSHASLFLDSSCEAHENQPMHGARFKFKYMLLTTPGHEDYTADGARRDAAQHKRADALLCRAEAQIYSSCACLVRLKSAPDTTKRGQVRTGSGVGQDTPRLVVSGAFSSATSELRLPKLTRRDAGATATSFRCPP